MKKIEGKYNFPVIKRVRLRNFSLYKKGREVELDFADGVFCLAGANGIGKSTFLLAVNYGLTGRVQNTRDSYKSLDEYFSRTLKSSSEFFDGRIREDDRDRAEIEMEIKLPHKTIVFSRGMFEPDALNKLVVEDEDEIIEYEGYTPSELNDIYCRVLVEEIGLSTFEQFVFLQHFVLTFDESRHLLFWNHRQLTTALFIAFGIDAEEAKKADLLRKKMDKAGSDARNLSWDRKQIENKLKDLEGLEVDASDIGDFEEEYEALLSELESAESDLEKIHNKQKESSLKLAELTAERAKLRTDYEELFEKHVATSGSIAEHPLIKRSMNQEKCQLCDSNGDAAIRQIGKLASAGKCPICTTSLDGSGGSRKGLQELKSVDKKLGAVNRKIKEIIKRRNRLTADLQESEADVDEATVRFEKFTTKNQKKISRLEAARSEDAKGLVQYYRDQLSILEKDKREKYKERDSYKAQLDKLQKRLASSYRSAETVFVPLFVDYAKKFLGMQLSISFESKPIKGVSLLLSVRGDDRRDIDSLSESQRFFVDIALRMALVHYMSIPEWKATLFIDTPEGSLDIAYESKAGEMFASFARNGFNILMTANINASRLLLSLAEKSLPDQMAINRMTGWTVLSTVQIAEEGLFEQAYSAIEKAIKKTAKR